jgi:hypothetical protein
LHPGYGCSPDIATHCPRPAGEGAERRRRGRGGGAGRSVWVACRLKAGRDGAGKEQGVWSVRDRGGGTSSPSPSAPPPNAISPRSSARLPTGSTPGTAFHQVSRALPPPAGRGRGRSAGGAGGVGAAGRECTGIPTKARVGWRLPAEWGMPTNRRIGIWRQGRGEAPPLPVSLSPDGDIHHGPLHGDKPAKNLSRLPAGSTPDTAFHQVSPRTDPAPPVGAGEERRRRGRGGGAGEVYGYPPGEKSR